MDVSTLLKNIREYNRYVFVNKNNIKKLKNKDITLISSDCTGGVIMHDLKQRFNSPTVNMFFSSDDFIKFLKNINYYLDCTMKDITCADDKWPVAKLGDITLQLVHYRSVSEAQEAWNRRRKRIVWDNIFVIMNDRNGCTEDNLKEFEKINFRKAFLTCNKAWVEKYKCAYYISKSEVNGENAGKVRTITGYIPKWGFHRLVDEFDYVSFLNGELE